MTLRTALLDPLYRRLTRPAERPRPLASLGLRALRRLAPLLGDPLVELRLAGMPLQVPLSHDLASIRARLPEYSAALGRLAAHVVADQPHAALIDIGANVGDTVAIVRGHAAMPVLCIEASDFYFALLRHNLAGQRDVELVLALVAGEPGLAARLDRSRGSAAAVPGQGGPTSRTLGALLAERPAFDAAARILKIDTDGMDGSILRGSRGWLAQRRPILAFEYDPYLWARAGDVDAAAVFPFLAELGYETALFYENEGGYVASAPLSAQAELAALHAAVEHGRGRRYYDVFVFTPADAARYRAFRAAERTRPTLRKAFRPLLA